MQRVRLIKKLAPLLNGLDLSQIKVGDVVELPNAAAEMLIREEWAELVSSSERLSASVE